MKSWQRYPHSFLAMGILTVAFLAPVAQSQTFTVLHTFTGGVDGGTPWGGLALDRNGNLYGAATFGGNAGCNGPYGHGCGVIFKMTHRTSGWQFAPLYKFTGSNGDGANPVATPLIAPDGTIYGTTDSGGTGSCEDLTSGCGTVYHLRPPLRVCAALLCPWNESVLHGFSGGADGANPTGGVIFDASGNLDGTAQYGGAGGVVYQLTLSQGGWTESVLYSFLDAPDGAVPYAGLTIDTSGNLYGTTVYGGNDVGTVYRLTPSSSGWTENVLYSFQGGEDGANPTAGVTLDPAGNVYGASLGSPFNAVFRLSLSGDSWNFSNVYSIETDGRVEFHSTLARDALGNLYGASFEGGTGCIYGCGYVFKLTPGEGGWTYTTLYEFTGGTDGGTPYGGVVLDSQGNIYGTTTTGGNSGYGTVWEITQ